MGSTKIQCNKIAIDPKEANAAKTLMCPTFLISLGHWIELNRNPMKYPVNT